MKVAIIGVGTVGSAVATAVKNTGLVHEIVLFDRDAVRARAAAEDLGHAASFGFDVNISAASNYRAIRGSDIVIIAAGKNQKPGETRTDLLQNNAAVIRDIVPRVMANVDSKRVILIIVTNPLDVMVMLAQKLSKLPAFPRPAYRSTSSTTTTTSPSARWPPMKRVKTIRIMASGPSSLHAACSKR